MRKISWGFGLAVLLASAAWIGRSAFAEVKDPNEVERSISVKVAQIMEGAHITRHRADEEISKRVYKVFLQMFDPLKLYFLQGDVDEFSPHQAQLAGAMKRGDLSFALSVYRRYMERLDERVGWVNQLLDEKLDLTQEESIVVDPETNKYAKDASEAKARWKSKVKYELCAFVVDGKTEKEAQDRVRKRYNNLKKRQRQIDTDELVEMYLTALTTSYDPHSTYMSPRTHEDFRISIELSLEGIGALLQGEDDGTTKIKEVVPGGAASKDGRLKPGDRIVAVGEGPGGEIVDIVDMKLRDVVKLIRGKAGTIVRLEVIPNNQKARTTYQLTRQKIELQDREAKGEIIVLPPQANNQAVRVGVIRLPSFYAEADAGNNGRDKRATADVRRILDEFKTKGVDAVVMDLRKNGGGLLTEAIDLTGLFIDEGPVVQVKDFKNEVTRYQDQSPGVAYSGPLVVLVSKFSASASEIFAGAIQDYHRGLVVGDSTTHGKGSVQKVLDLSRIPPNFFGAANMGAVKVTMQKFYRVNGDSTQNRGVVSDVVLPSETDHDDFGEAKLDYALSFDHINEAEHVAETQVKPEVVKQLRALSGDRQKSKDELVKLVKRKQRMQERRSRKVITFNEASMRKENAELSDEEKDAAKDDEDGAAEKKDKPFGSDAYTREVLAVTADFVRLRDATFTAK